MRTNIKNIFLPVFPRIMGKTVKKTTPSTVGPYKHNQDQPVKILTIRFFVPHNEFYQWEKPFFSPGCLRRILRGKSGKKGRTTPSDATHEIIVYGRSKTANVDVFFVRILVFMVL